jgi:hypothetical protein
MGKNTILRILQRVIFGININLRGPRNSQGFSIEILGFTSLLKMAIYDH